MSSFLRQGLGYGSDSPCLPSALDTPCCSQAYGPSFPGVVPIGTGVAQMTAFHPKQVMAMLKKRSLENYTTIIVAPDNDDKKQKKIVAPSLAGIL